MKYLIETAPCEQVSDGTCWPYPDKCNGCLWPDETGVRLDVKNRRAMEPCVLPRGFEQPGTWREKR